MELYASDNALTAFPKDALTCTDSELQVISLANNNIQCVVCFSFFPWMSVCLAASRLRPLNPFLFLFHFQAIAGWVFRSP